LLNQKKKKVQVKKSGRAGEGRVEEKVRKREEGD